MAGHVMPVRDYIVDRVIKTAAKDKMRRRLTRDLNVLQGIESFEKERHDINKQLRT
ncbi:MAG: hypothetical protein Q9223_006463, partial [Gallowayella weberi]